MGQKRDIGNLSFEQYHAYRTGKSWDASSFGVCDTIDARYFDVELARSGIRATQGAAVLEIGFGNGQFAAWAAYRGLSYVGTELDDVLVELARGKGFEAFPATLDLTRPTKGKKFNFIVAFDVLEHLSVEEIITLLRSASECLVDGGSFLARFPSGDSPFARSIQYGDWTHRTTIGSGIVHQLAYAAGLDVAQIRSPAFPVFGLGLRRFCRRVPIVLIREFVSAIINVAFHDNQPKVITPNTLVVLRRPARMP